MANPSATAGLSYQSSAGANKVIKASAGTLHRIIVGADVSSAVIEVSDDASDGDGNVVIKLSSDTLLADTGGSVEVEAKFTNGITADLTNQTSVTFVYS